MKARLFLSALIATMLLSLVGCSSTPEGQATEYDPPAEVQVGQDEASGNQYSTPDKPSTE